MVMPWPDREQQPPPSSSGLRSSPIMIYTSAGPTLAPPCPSWPLTLAGRVDGAGRSRVQLGGKKAQGKVDQKSEHLCMGPASVSGSIYFQEGLSRAGCLGIPPPGPKIFKGIGVRG